MNKLVRLFSNQHMFWVLTNESGKRHIEQQDVVTNRIVDFEHYNVQALTLKFLDPRKRSEVTENWYLIEFVGNGDN